MCERTYRLTTVLLFVTVILLAGTQAGESRRAFLDCNPEWILCGAETIDYNSSVHGTDFPGAYIVSGMGTTRFGLTCETSVYTFCYVYVAYWTGSGWAVLWTDAVNNGARHLIMHGSGNLQVYNDNYTTVLWETNTDINETDAYLNVHDNGCVSLWHEDESGTFWSTCS